jgi:hypothetical protein
MQQNSNPHTQQKTVWRFLKKLKMELPYDPVKLVEAIWKYVRSSQYE